MSAMPARLLTVAILLPVWAAATYASDLVLAVHEEALFERLELPFVVTGVSPWGAKYEVVENGKWITLVLGVHPVAPQRSAWRSERTDHMPSNPKRGVAEDLGDDRLVWGGPGESSSTIHVLRGNVTFTLWARVPWDEGLSIARAIDDAIQRDRAVAPTGTFEETPRIETVGAPAEIEPLEAPAHVEVVTSWATLRPVFNGLGDAERLYVGIIGRHFSNLVWSAALSRTVKVRTRVNSMESWMDPQPDSRRLRPEEDGRFFLIPSADAEPGKVHRLTMVAVNEDNVVVTKEFEVRVAERP